MASDPGPVAIGTWSGGRFMHFGEPLEDQRFQSLIAPDEAIRTVITADVYGQGAADEMLGRSLAGKPRDEFCVVGAVGHDFYSGQRDGPRGFPRFTDAQLRGEDDYADYLKRATEHSLERCGIDRFDLLLLHNPDRIGYTNEAVWEGMAALSESGLTRLIGVAPGPANGFTLDLIACLERFGSLIDWAMIILGPLEPWPGELCLDAAADGRRQGDHPRGRLRRPVLRRSGPGQAFAHGDHRGFRPAGWIEAGRAPHRGHAADRRPAGLTMIQLACQWNLAHGPVACVAPTLIQEVGSEARPVEDKRAELAALPPELRLTERRRRGDPRARRQHRLHVAQGRQPRSTPARSGPIAGRSMSSSRRWPTGGGSSPSATCPQRGGGVSWHEHTSTGGCNCGAVRFEVTAPLVLVHATATAPAASAAPEPPPRPTRGRARARSGSSQGEDRLRAWKPEGGAEKWFCGDCGSALFTRDPDDPDAIGVRLGAIDGDPGVRPSAHQFVAYAAVMGADPR